MDTLHTDAGVVTVRSCKLGRADQGNLAGEMGTFCFDARDRDTVNRANLSAKPVQLRHNNGRVDVILTGVTTSIRGLQVDCVADFVVTRLEPRP